LTKKYIPNLDTFADLCDRLAVTVQKLGFFENMKREEHAKDNPDRYLIAHWDNLSRNECEYRNLIKCKINEMLTQIIEDGQYQTLPDNRTFRSPPKEIGDILADQYVKVDISEFKKEFGENLRRLFK